MTETKNFRDFFTENKNLIKDYIDLKLSILRLKGVHFLARAAGNLLWIIISLVMISWLVVFAGITMGLWLSKLTGSYIMGFGYTTLVFLILISLLALFRKPLFINPIIRLMAKEADNTSDEPTDTSSTNHS